MRIDTFALHIVKLSTRCSESNREFSNSLKALPEEGIQIIPEKFHEDASRMYPPTTTPPGRSAGRQVGRSVDAVGDEPHDQVQPASPSSKTPSAVNTVDVYK